MTETPPNYLVTSDARADLSEIWSYLAHKRGEATADRVLARINGEFERLASLPGLGHYRDELLGREYRFYAVWSYLIVYRWQAVPLQILCIVHGARDLPKFFAQRPLEGF